MPTSTQQIALEMLLKSDEFKKEVKKAAEKVGAVGDETGKASKKSTGFLKKMKVGWLAVAAAVAVAVRAVARFTKESIQAASDFEEANAKFQTVFRGVTREASMMRDELVRAYAMSRLEATTFLSSIQDMLVPMGLARGKAAEMGGEIVKLAADLGSFNNMPTADVMRGIQSALAGQIEPMRQYGVFLTQNRIEQEALNMGLIKAGEELTVVAKAQATLAIITKDSTDAIGDMARTSDSWANTLKRINAFVEDLKVGVGQELVDALKPAVAEIDNFTKSADRILQVRQVIQDVINFFQLLGTAVKLVVETILTQFTIALIAVTSFVTTSSALLDQFSNVWRAAWDRNLEGVKAALRAMGEISKTSILQQNADVTEQTDVISEQWELLKQRWRDLMQDRVEVEVETTDLMTEQRAEWTQQDLDAHFAALDAKATADQAARDKELTAELSNRLKLLAIATDFWKKFGALAEKFRSQELTAEIARVQRQVDANFITQEEGDKKTKALKRKAFVRDQNIAIGEALINGAIAITKILATWAAFPPVAAALSVLTAALTAAQIGVISQAAPGFAEGGVAGLRGPELITVGERGPEVITPVAEWRNRLLGNEGTSIRIDTINLEVEGGAQGAIDLVEELENIADQAGRESFFYA